MQQRGIGCLTVPVLAVAMVGGLLLSGCGSDDSKKKLTGERIAVLQNTSRATPDLTLATLAVAVPLAVANNEWPQGGGQPDHAMGNLALSGQLERKWRSSIGSGSGRMRLVSPPVVSNGRVFALDSHSRLTALSESDGERLWRTELTPEETQGSSFGGGIAVAQDVLYAATGYAEVIALNPANGKILWRKPMPSPARGGPTIVNGRVVTVTIDNQTVALNARSGDPEWTHSGILEPAGLVGSVCPAANASTVVVPYSSGEVTALRVENGRPLWQDNLAAIRRSGALSNLADIRAMPVIDRGLVFAVSHSGRTVAIDERTGARVWEAEIGGVNTPSLAGDFVFQLTNDSEVVALKRDTGQVRWAKMLDRFEDTEDKKSDAVIWSGPVLAGDRLWLVSSNEQMLGLSPQDGRILTTLELPSGSFIAPVVANGTLYVLTDDGDIVAYR